MQKQIVINADDFGITSATTRGILKGMDDGVISDVSLMANGKAFDEAAEGLLKRGIRQTGIHLCAIDGEKPLTLGPSCLAPKGVFFKNRYFFLAAYLLNPKVSREYLKKEFKTQIEKIQSAGLRISHLDSHQHLHIFPGIAELCIELCKEYQISFIRIPENDGKTLVTRIANFFARRLKNTARADGLHTVRMLGFESSGQLTKAMLEKWFRRVSKTAKERFELMTHPGFQDEETHARYRHWHYHWADELQVLTQYVPELLKIHQVRLAKFSDWVQA